MMEKTVAFICIILLCFSWGSALADITVLEGRQIEGPEITVLCIGGYVFILAENQTSGSRAVELIQVFRQWGVQGRKMVPMKCEEYVGER